MDRVQVVKDESAALGGDGADEVEWGSTPLDPKEDAIEAAGLFVQDPSNRDETTLISRLGLDMLFKDGNNTVSVTLTALLAAGAGGAPVEVIFTSVGSISVNHAKGIRPLVQVTRDIPGDGWNQGGYNSSSLWNATPGVNDQRIPDDEYTLVHLDANTFVVTLAATDTGKVIYF